MVLAEVGNGVMTLCWTVFFLVLPVALLAWLVRRLDRWRWLHWLLSVMPVLALLAGVAGWLYRELGRQPWAVWHHMTTAEAITPLSVPHAVASFVVFTGAFAVLAGITWWLLVRYARRGPHGGPLAPAPSGDDAPAVPVHTY